MKWPLPLYLPQVRQYDSQTHPIDCQIGDRTPKSVTYNSRVADTRVYMTKSPEIRSRNDRGKREVEMHAPQSKQICTVLQVDRESQTNLGTKRKNNYSAIVEDKTRRGIDGHCPCVCSRIGNLTSMKLKSIEFWFTATK